MKSWATLTVLALDALVILWGQTDRPLTTIDDLREVEVAREMRETGDYVVPHLAGLPFVEKPPGFQIVVALAYTVAGGPSVPAARMVAVGFALLSLVAVFLLGRRSCGPIGGLVAATVLAMSPIFCRTAHEIILDNALTAALSWASLFTWIGLSASRSSYKCYTYAGAGFALGCAFMFKGLVGLGLFGAGAVGYLVLARRPSELRYAPLALIGFAAPVLAWVIPFVGHATPELQREFFVENQFGRALHAYASHVRPAWFYAAWLWHNFGPGAIALPFAAVSAWRARRSPEGGPGLFFLSAAVGPLLLLTALSARDTVYMLPVFPALSLLVAWWCVRCLGRPSPLFFALIGVAAVGSVVAVGAALVVTGLLTSFGVGLIALFAIPIFGLTELLVVWRKRDWTCIGVVTAAMFAVFWMVFFSPPIAQEELSRQGWYEVLPVLIPQCGDRKLLLYRPDDQRRGACGFFRNRTAEEVPDAGALVDRLIAERTAIAMLNYDDAGFPREIIDAAAARGVKVQEEASAPYRGLPMVLFRVIGSSPRSDQR